MLRTTGKRSDFKPRPNATQTGTVIEFARENDQEFVVVQFENGRYYTTLNRAHDIVPSEGMRVVLTWTMGDYRGDYWRISGQC